jgi:hypothetical protein
MIEPRTIRYDPGDLNLKTFEEVVVPAIEAGARAECVVLGRPHSLTKEGLTRLREMYYGSNSLAHTEALQVLQAAKGTVAVTMLPGKQYLVN